MAIRTGIFFLLFLLSSPVTAQQQANPERPEIIPVKIGVLAFRGARKAHKRWDNVADYLSNQIPGYSFEIDTFDLKEMDEAVKQKRIDFVLTNPGNYVRLEALFGATRITTLSNLHQGKYYTVYGAVILTRADNKSIRTLRDLRGRSFMAVSRQAFGGFQMAWLELHQQKINPFRDFSRLVFNGFPQDKIVLAILDGKVDAGTVRAETFARMVDEKRINASDFYILNQKSSKEYPFPHSTRLYPEWAFAKLNHSDETLAQKVAIALLTSTVSKNETPGPQHINWTIPLDYSLVHETFRTLNIGPYSHTTEVTLANVWEKYSQWIIAVSFIIVLIIFTSLLVVQINRRLSASQIALKKQIEVRKQAEQKLARHSDILEETISERTRELKDLNLKLEHDIQVRKHIEEILRSSDTALKELYKITSSVGINFDQKVMALLKFGTEYFDLSRGVLCKYENQEYTVTRLFSATDAIANDKFPFCFGMQIMAHDKIDGAIFFTGHTSSSKELTSVDQDILQLIAQWLGGEIERQDTEQKAREHRNQLAHVSRLGTMGEMASGLAHELNQPLTAIANFTRGCVRRLQAGDPDMPAILAAMDYTVRESVRAAEIIKRLRAFVSKGEVSRSPVALNDIIDIVIDLSANEIEVQQITLKLDLDTSLPETLVDHIQIEQVVLNLLRNSIDSLQSTEQPRIITISTDLQDELIVVKLGDNGPGISAEDRDKLFHPFFTTKKQGMGLGLSISRSIIEAHGGQLEIADNESTSGCQFKFTLPATNSKMSFNNE